MFQKGRHARCNRACQSAAYDEAICCFGRENKGGAGTSPAPLASYLFLRRAVPVFFAVDFFAAAVLRAGFLFAVFLFAAIVHPSFGLAGCQVTLATSTRRYTRIAFETRAVTDEGKATALFTHFPSRVLTSHIDKR